MPTQPFMQSLQIENFRTLRSLRLDPLRRITLLGGLNGTGKTTVLDAIFQFVDTHNPILLLRSAGFRQTPADLTLVHRVNEGAHPDLPSVHKFKTRQGSYECIWQWGTYDINPTDPQVISTEGVLQSHNTLQEGYKLTFKKDGKNVLCRYYASQGIESLRFKQEGDGVVEFPNTNYLSRLTTYNSSDLATRYSFIVQKGMKRKFLNVLNSISREFEDVELLQVGPSTVLHVTLDGVIIPLAFAGDGVVTIAAIALGIMNAPGGIVIIDEFDASIHHSMLRKVWKIIHDLAIDYDSQIVVATHSRESVVSLFESISPANKNDAVYYRLDLVDGKNVATRYDWDEIREADTEGWEIR